MSIVEIPRSRTESYSSAGFTSGPPWPNPNYTSSDLRQLQMLAMSYAIVARKGYWIAAKALGIQGPKPPAEIEVLLSYRYVAGEASEGGRIIRVSAAYALSHPGDLGLIVHEVTHVVQGYRFDNPRWLVEGIADYVRYYFYEPRSARPRAHARDADPEEGYKQTAQFLHWAAARFGENLVPELNRALRSNSYGPDVWLRVTGKALGSLESDWKASLPP